MQPVMATRSRSPLPLWCLWCALASIALPAAAETVALLPATGAASPAARSAIDRQLRDHVSQEAGVVVLPPSEIRRQLDAARAMSLACTYKDVSCLVKFGLLASATVVWAPVADGSGLTILVVDVLAAAERRTVSGAVVAKVADEALGKTHAEFDPVMTTPSASPPTPPPPVANPVARGALVAFAPGVVLAAGGGALSIFATSAAVLCELLYARQLGALDKDTRANLIQPAGAAMWVTAGAGAVVGFVGGLVAIALAEHAAVEEGPAS